LLIFFLLSWYVRLVTESNNLEIDETNKIEINYSLPLSIFLGFIDLILDFAVWVSWFNGGKEIRANYGFATIFLIMQLISNYKTYEFVM
jgi:hypothetical protein